MLPISRGSTRFTMSAKVNITRCTSVDNSGSRFSRCPSMSVRTEPETLFIRPAITSAGLRVSPPSSATDRKSRIMTASTSATTFGSRRGTRDRRNTTFWANAVSRCSSTAAARSDRSSLRTTAAVCGCSFCRNRATATAGANPILSQSERFIELSTSPIIRLTCWVSSAPSSIRRATPAPPAISAPSPRVATNSATTLRMAACGTRFKPLMETANRRSCASLRSRINGADCSGPSAASTIAAFCDDVKSIGVAF